MGPRVLINGIWYKTRNRNDRHQEQGGSDLVRVRPSRTSPWACPNRHLAEHGHRRPLGMEIFDGRRYPKQSEDEDREMIIPTDIVVTSIINKTAFTPLPPLGAIPTFGGCCAA